MRGAPTAGLNAALKELERSHHAEAAARQDAADAAAARALQAEATAAAEAELTHERRLTRRQLRDTEAARREVTIRSSVDGALLREELAVVEAECHSARAELRIAARELRRNHEKLQVENEEVRRIVGDMYVSVDEDRNIREKYVGLYKQVMATLSTPAPKTGELMPQIYDCLVRMNDEDIRKEYITQMEIILNDDPNVSEKVKGIAEVPTVPSTIRAWPPRRRPPHHAHPCPPRPGLILSLTAPRVAVTCRRLLVQGLSIKLGEMMDQPRHQRIARLAKEEEEKRKAQEMQQEGKKEQEKRLARQSRQKDLNRMAFEALMPMLRRIAGPRPCSNPLPSCPNPIPPCDETATTHRQQPSEAPERLMVRPSTLW